MSPVPARRFRHVAWLGGCLSVCLAVSIAAQGNPKAALLGQAGWNALASGQPRAAADAFTEAVASDPRDARLQFGRALALAALARDAESMVAVERALALEPNLRDARELLGRLQYRRGDLPGAIRTYEPLVTSGPASASLRATLERWRREAALHLDMRTVIGSGVTVSFEGPADERLANLAVESLERAAARIGTVLMHYPSSPIPVVLYTGEQFRDITQAPSWAAGAFDGTIRLPVRGALGNTSELDRVLAHEYVHALVLDLAGRGVPTWLNEGLASVFETERVPPPRPPTLPLRVLEQPFSRLPAAQAGAAYDFSAFAVRRLIDDGGGVAVANLLRDLKGGVPFAAAFERRTGQSLAVFEASLARSQ
jgi:hypothetical protein